MDIVVKILFVATEAASLIKVGGLADVINSLPRALRKLGHDVRLIIPRYGVTDITRQWVFRHVDHFNISDGKTSEPVNLQQISTDDRDIIYLMENYNYFGSGGIYGEGELERFYFFCRAVVEILPQLDWQPDIIHCHDWHTALIPMMLKLRDDTRPVIFTIHNLGYQGPFDRNFMFDYGLDKYWRHRPDGAPETPLNFMSQGILWADIVTTVSETYASEIVTSKYGQGLDKILHYRQDRLIGIINGIDKLEFCPALDPLIVAKYDSSRLHLKELNKTALQERAGLPVDSILPLMGVISRLDSQKGIDILSASFDAVFQNTNAQIIILGQGSEHYHRLLMKAVDKYPQRIAVFLEFNEEIAHLIYAGCDMFLMPSLYEPCGLGQLIAMSYGAVPVVRRTGGLADTVHDLTPDLSEGNGFVFLEYSAESLISAILRAVETFKNSKETWSKVIQRIMAIDYSWDASAKKYEAVYRNILEGEIWHQ